MLLTTLRRPRLPAAAPARPPSGHGPRAARGLRRLATAAPFLVPSLAGVLLFLLIPVVIVLDEEFAELGHWGSCWC